MLNKELFPKQILKLIFLNVRQIPFTLMNGEFEFLHSVEKQVQFLCSLMMPSFNKDIRPHSQQPYSHQLLFIMSITIQYYCQIH